MNSDCIKNLLHGELTKLKLSEISSVLFYMDTIGINTLLIQKAEKDLYWCKVDDITKERSQI